LVYGGRCEQGNMCSGSKWSIDDVETRDQVLATEETCGGNIARRFVRE
jgi:hypothetical protein